MPTPKLRVGVCRPQFQNVTVGWTNFCSNDTLGQANFSIKCALSWHFLDKTFKTFAFSEPKFKKMDFFTGIADI